MLITWSLKRVVSYISLSKYLVYQEGENSSYNSSCFVCPFSLNFSGQNFSIDPLNTNKIQTDKIHTLVIT